jgi:30S ribosomal protein S31
VGRGDKRTAKGKRFKGSHGNTRPRKPKKKVGGKKTAAPAAKKTAAKK